MAFECPRRSSPPSPMFDADTGCIATDPAPSARRRFRSKTGIENLPANEHAQETPHTPSPTRTTRRIQSGCAGSRPRLRDGMPGSPSQHIDITRAKWIPYLRISSLSGKSSALACPAALKASSDVAANRKSLRPDWRRPFVRATTFTLPPSEIVHDADEPVSVACYMQATCQWRPIQALQMISSGWLAGRPGGAWQL